MTQVESFRQKRYFRFQVRFGLRTFLIAFAMISALFGLLGRELIRAHKQQALVNELTTAGAQIAFDYQSVGGKIELSRVPSSNSLRWIFGKELFTHVVYIGCIYQTPVPEKVVARFPECPELANVILDGPQFSDQVVPHLERLRLLEGLGLRSVSISSDGFVKLANCPKLSNLSLCGDFVTDAHLKSVGCINGLRVLQIVRAPSVSNTGVSSLAVLKHLECLDFYSVPKLSDDGAAVVASFPNLKSLNFLDTSITDATLDNVGKLTRLERLGLRGHPIHDAGVSALSGLKTIRSLQLSDTNISDMASSTIGSLYELVELDLSGTSVSDRSLETFARLPKLRSLELVDTSITEAGLQKLREAKTLRYISVTLGPSLTRQGAKRLKEVLPQCKIDCWGKVSAAAGGSAELEATE